MSKRNKSQEVEATKPMNIESDSAPKGYIYTNVFCPRCGRFNVHHHRIFKHRYVCGDCGHKWR